MNKDIVKVFFPKAVDNFEKNKCVFCEEEVKEKDFRDKISKREYEISGICQKCQDQTFI